MSKNRKRNARSKCTLSHERVFDKPRVKNNNINVPTNKLISFQHRVHLLNHHIQLCWDECICSPLSSQVPRQTYDRRFTEYICNIFLSHSLSRSLSLSLSLSTYLSTYISICLSLSFSFVLSLSLIRSFERE